jgi:hypothetical protein
VLDFQLVLYFINFAVQNVGLDFHFKYDNFILFRISPDKITVPLLTVLQQCTLTSWQVAFLALACTAFVVFFSSSHLRPNELASQQAVLVHGGAALSSKMTSFHV